MSSPLKKIYILDSLRGITAFFVALYHFLHFENQHGSIIAKDNATLTTLDPILEGSVCIFFLISGYVIYLHLESNGFRLKHFGTFLLKRITRTHIPLLVCLLLIISIDFAFKSTVGAPVNFSFEQFLANFTLTAEFFNVQWYNPIFWTLSIEFQFYLFIGLIFVLLKQRPFLILIVLAMALIPLNYYVNTMGTVAYLGSYFIIGIALYLVHQGKFELWQLYLLVLIGTIDVVLNQEFLYYLFPLLSIPVILLVSMRSKILEKSGEISYSFYLMHGLVGGWFLYFTARYADQDWQKALLIAGALVLSYLGALPFYRWIEKTSYRLTRKISYKK